MGEFGSAFRLSPSFVAVPQRCAGVSTHLRLFKYCLLPRCITILLDPSSRQWSSARVSVPWQVFQLSVGVSVLTAEEAVPQHPHGAGTTWVLVPQLGRPL